MTRLVIALRQLGLQVAIEPQLNDFIALFLKWNKSINLSSARSVDEITDHVVDSLHVIPYLTNAKRVLDVGSGGGFPVVIAAICLPDTDFVALEPVHKKHAFLRTAARETEIGNLDARAERLGDHAGRDYDLAMSRATFDLADWLAMGSEYVRPGGVVVGFEALARNDLEDVERHPYASADKHRAIVIRRRRFT